MTTPGSRFLILAVKASEPQSLSKTLPRARRDPLANRFNGHQEVLDYSREPTEDQFPGRFRAVLSGGDRPAIFAYWRAGEARAEGAAIR
jgi:hypothetical protein